MDWLIRNLYPFHDGGMRGLSRRSQSSIVLMVTTCQHGFDVQRCARQSATISGVAKHSRSQCDGCLQSSNYEAFSVQTPRICLRFFERIVGSADCHVQKPQSVLKPRLENSGVGKYTTIVWSTQPLSHTPMVIVISTPLPFRT